MKLLTIGSIVCLALIACASCGDDDASSGPPVQQEDATDSIAPPKPSYEFNADGVACSEGARVTTTTAQTGCTITGCMWLCADYEGQYPVDVNIHFRRCPDEGPDWEIVSESVMQHDTRSCEAILSAQAQAQ